jgi:CYTH domain-containing protein
MAKEHELRFVCSTPQNLSSFPSKNIYQGYIHVDAEKQVRVRIVPDTEEATMCVKFMNDGFSRDEFEAPLSFEEGLELFNKCKFQLRKVRYRLTTEEGLPIDLDIYEDGKIIGEIELPSLDTTFTKPAFFIKQATDYEYTNYHYAGIPKGFSNVCLS